MAQVLHRGIALADRVMRTNAKGKPRMKALMYLSSALEANRVLEAEGQKQFLAEAAAVDQEDLAINDPDQIHQLRLYQGGSRISALQVACLRLFHGCAAAYAGAGRGDRLRSGVRAGHGEIARRQWRHDRLQLLAVMGIGGVELRVPAEQADQKQPPLQIEQARVAMEVPMGLAGPGDADAAVQRRQFGGQQRLQIVVMGWHNGAERRKALRQARSKMRIRQGGGHLLDHRLRHLALATAVPLQADG